MIEHYLNWLMLNFCASPHHTIDRILAMSDNVWADRAARNALAPGFPADASQEKPSEKPFEKPPQKPARPMPTDVPQPEPMDVPVPEPMDVPVPEPMDVPVPEPRDVPVPDPGTEPQPAKPQPGRKAPKPRSVP